MKSVSKAHLVKLLEAQPGCELRSKCLSELLNYRDLEVPAGGPVSTKNIEKIYSRRSHRNDKAGLGIVGFPTLLDGLAVFNEDKLIIVCFDGETCDFSVFMDLEMSRIIGCLAIPIQSHGSDPIV